MAFSTIIGDAVRHATNAWKFRGGQSGPRTFDVDAPILPVADLSPMARLGGASGNDLGFHLMRVVNAHAGPGVLTGSTDVWTTLRALAAYSGIDPALNAVWLLKSTIVTESPANTTNVAHGLLFPLNSFSGADQNGGMVFPFFDSATEAALAINNTTPTALTPYVNELRENQFPMPVPFGGLLRSTSTAGAAVNVHHVYLLWIGPRGVLPPGLA